MGQASVVVVVMVMSFKAARAALLIGEHSGAVKRHSGCRSGESGGRKAATNPTTAAAATVKAYRPRWLVQHH